MKLLASYHEIHDDDDFNRSRGQIAELYERAALPIEKGGMGLTNISLVSLTAFQHAIDLAQLYLYAK